MPSAKAGMDSRAAQLIGFPRKSKVRFLPKKRVNRVRTKRKGLKEKGQRGLGGVGELGEEM